MSSIESATEVVERRRIDLKYDEETATLYYKTISDLTNSIKDLQNEVNNLKEVQQTNHKVIFVKEMPFEEAKKLVFDIIQKHKIDGIETLDIAEQACLSIDVVLEAISKLEEEGKIGKSD